MSSTPIDSLVETSRARFEHWFEKHFSPTVTFSVTYALDVDDDYTEWDVQCAWLGWQESLRQALAQPRE